MKKAHVFRIIMLLLVLALPLSRVNTVPGAISDIDNKYLTDFPDIDLGFSEFLQQTNEYLTDRMGGRERLLQMNATINNKLFDYLDHPSYEYGREGYVYPKLNRFSEDFEFLDQFTDTLLAIQNYCHDRNIPFVYELNPAKWSVYPQFLPDGYNYQNNRLEYLQQALIDKQIIHVDATDFLKNLSQTDQVFNQQYDAGHWNAIGAFHSVNQLLDKMSELEPTIVANNLEDYLIDQKLITSHAVSKIKIHEYIPTLTLKEQTWDYVDMDLSDEVILHPQHQAFFRTESEANNDINLLMFHGSGFNGHGHKYIAPAVKSYQGIHNYQNMIDFDYYFNIFQPNFVVINSAEYATTGRYFNLEYMQEKQLNPVLKIEEFVPYDIFVEDLEVVRDYFLTTLFAKIPNIDYGYIVHNGITYDLIPDGEDYWSISSLDNEIDLNNATLYVITLQGEKRFMDLRH